jgi:hypothetical protein
MNLAGIHKVELILFCLLNEDPARSRKCLKLEKDQSYAMSK